MTHLEEKNHVHTPVVQLDGLLKCQICGEHIPVIEENITIADSRVRANRVMEEVAVSGHYRASAYHDGFVVYSRTVGDIQEELSVQKISARRYRVYKITIQIGGGVMI